MHIKEAVLHNKDLERFADGLVILREQTTDAWDQERMTIAVSILRAMAAESVSWSLIPTEDLDELKTHTCD